MTIHYDHEIFTKFRALAVTEPETLRVGQTYWSNQDIEPRKLKELITQAEMLRRNRLGVDGADDFSPRWMIFEGRENWSESLRDRNIGASYNPWLIFADEATAKRCRDELPVRITSDWLDYPLD